MLCTQRLDASISDVAVTIMWGVLGKPTCRWVMSDTNWRTAAYMGRNLQPIPNNLGEPP